LETGGIGAEDKLLHFLEMTLGQRIQCCEYATNANPGFRARFQRIYMAHAGLAPQVRYLQVSTSIGRNTYVPTSLSKKEQRKWARLDLAIPVFVRTRDGNGRDSLEFATAINISPGGALVVSRRSLAKLALVSLEIPSAPIGPTKLKISPRIIRAKAVWVTHLDDHHLVGLKFSRALSTDAATVPGKYLRKASAAV
jgi:PilZ domain